MIGCCTAWSRALQCAPKNQAAVHRTTPQPLLYHLLKEKSTLIAA